MMELFLKADSISYFSIVEKKGLKTV